MRIKTMRAAFPLTIPVMMGYVFMGMAFGILLSSKGYHFGWAFLMSVTIYAGSMQFVAIDLLTKPFNIVAALMMTLMVNARHVFYGLSMLDKFKRMDRRKSYMIHALTDETFSLLCAARPPEGVKPNRFYFYIALLNHLYWIAGCTIGGIIGTLFKFNTKGIDFVMTALFVVIFTEQWQSTKNHVPALIGIFASLLCLLIFGADRFLIPSMAAIFMGLAVCRRPLEREEEA